jgi:hypothetical protein
VAIHHISEARFKPSSLSSVPVSGGDRGGLDMNGLQISSLDGEE